MPLFARIVQYGIAAILTAWASLVVWDIAAGNASPWDLWLPILCIVAVVGLLRRVAWGRFLVSCISVLTAFSIAANLIPADDDFYSGHIVLKHWLAHMSSVWLACVLVTVCSTPVLLPALVIGWRRSWFRSQWW